MSQYRADWRDYALGLKAENERLRADMVKLAAEMHARELAGYREREKRIEQAEARLARVAALHQPDEEYNTKHPDPWFHRCGCGHKLPCPTLAAAQPEEESRG